MPRSGLIAASALALALTAAVAVTAAGPARPAEARAALSWPSKCVTDSASRRGRSIFPELRALRTRVWVTGISWAGIAGTRPAEPRSPDDPAYAWPPNLELSLNKARAQGIEPVLYVNGFPRWSNGRRDATWVPNNPADYGDFMAAAVAKYPQVRRWIVFGEPSHWQNFQPQGDSGRRAPRLYAELLDAAYGAMHAVRPDVVVIGGNVHPTGANDHLTTAPDTFLGNMVLPDGRRPRLDMFGINPYTERLLDMRFPHRAGRVDFNDLDWFIRQLDRFWPGRRLQLFIAEFGWNTEHASKEWLYVVSHKEQARKLSNAYRLAAKMRRINTMCWFLLVDTPPRNQVNWTTGLRTWRGAKKPSWRAFARVPPGPSRLR